MISTVFDAPKILKSISTNLAPSDMTMCCSVSKDWRHYLAGNVRTTFDLAQYAGSTHNHNNNPTNSWIDISVDHARVNLTKTFYPYMLSRRQCPPARPVSRIW
ncbi:hypothetical protein CPC16_001053 [Podila verticillata]|nr:hypothetical protein CPC16_001053 [Podila verticillata]